MSRPLPSFGRSVLASFEIGVAALLGSRRALVTALLLGVPLLLVAAQRLAALLGRTTDTSAWALYGNWGLANYELGLAVPLVALLYAAAFAEEAENGTIVYLLTRPASRAALLLGRFAAFAVAALALALPAVALAGLLAAAADGGLSGVAAHAPDLARDAVAVTLATLAYGSVFTLFGTLFRRPLLPGLVVLFGWEGLSHLPGYLPHFTVGGPLRALISHRAPADGLASLITPGTVEVPTALTILFVVVVGFLGTALAVFRNKQYAGSAA